MDYAEMSTILTQTLYKRYSFLVIILGIGILLLLYYLYVRFTTKSNDAVWLGDLFFGKSKRKHKGTLMQQIFYSSATLVILLGYMFINGAEIIRDISNQQFLYIEGEYSRTERDTETNMMSYGTACVKANGQTYFFELPYGCTEEDFPLGTYSGIVCYSEESEYILEFIPVNNM